MIKVLTSLLIVMFIASCGGGSDSSSSSSATYISATLTHGGFDFSENEKSEDGDGSVVFWADNQVYASGESYDSTLWFRPNKSDDNYEKIYIYESSASSLNDITSVDSSKWIGAKDPYPSLKVGKIYVIQAMDGYVKFKVLSMRKDGNEADVEYKYSTSTQF